MKQINSNVKKIALGKTIRYFRIANDIKAKKLAEELRCTTAYISEVENGRKNVTVENLKNLAEVFKVKASDICYIQECLIEKNWDYQEAMIEILKICISYRKNN